MDAYRLNVKLYLKPTARLDLARFIPVFHRFIQEQTLDDLLIDVADYNHVPDGPGVMLIAHQANYGLDAVDGRLGLLYARKRPQEGDFTERLHAAFDQTLRAARALERDPALRGLKIPGDRLAVRILDRLAAPNDEQTFAAVEPELRPLLGQLYGGSELRLTREKEPGAPFGVQVETEGAPGIGTLLERLEAAVPVAVG